MGRAFLSQYRLCVNTFASILDILTGSLNRKIGPLPTRNASMLQVFYAKIGGRMRVLLFREEQLELGR